VSGCQQQTLASRTVGRLPGSQKELLTPLEKLQEYLRSEENALCRATGFKL